MPRLAKLTVPLVGLVLMSGCCASSIFQGR
jgi:hypothetical protein